MLSTRVRYGAALLGVLAVVDVVGSLLVPPPPEAPAAATLIGVGLGVLTLLALGVWYRTSNTGGGRPAMWVAVVLRVVAGVLAVLGLADMPVALGVVTVVLLVATLAAAILVRPALARMTTGHARTV